MKIPVIDLHCDLTFYMIEKPDASPMNAEEIGCAIPNLHQGNVRAQVMAFFTASEPILHGIAKRQAEILNKMVNDFPEDIAKYSTESSSKIKVIPAIENASGFCHEDQNLDDGLKDLEEIIEIAGEILYIGFMHWDENRFGGAAGNKTGLKDDGRVLLDYMDNRNIAVDVAHAGDNLITDIFDYVYKKGLNIPIIASHSNFRKVWNHKRNLPDALAKEIINNNGLIGVNFMSDYLGKNPRSIIEHIEYGIKIGAENNLAIGADFFWDEEKPAEKTYFKPYVTAATYPNLLSEITEKFSMEFAEKIAYRNAQSFLDKYF